MEQQKPTAAAPLLPPPDDLPPILPGGPNSADGQIKPPSNVIFYGSMVLAALVIIAVIIIMVLPPAAPKAGSTNSTSNSISNTIPTTSILSIERGLSLASSSQSVANGTNVTLSASWIWQDGNYPYTLSWYSGNSASCANDVQTYPSHSGYVLSSQTTNQTDLFSPNQSAYFCYKLLDSKGNYNYSSTTLINVTGLAAAYFDRLNVSMSPSSITLGQPTTINASWHGNRPPYFVAIDNSTSSSICEGDTLLPATSTNSLGFNYTFTPTSNGIQYYCLSVYDSAHPANIIESVVSVNVS